MTILKAHYGIKDNLVLPFHEVEVEAWGFKRCVLVVEGLTYTGINEFTLNYGDGDLETIRCDISSDKDIDSLNEYVLDVLPNPKLLAVDPTYYIQRDTIVVSFEELKYDHLGITFKRTNDLKQDIAVACIVVENLCTWVLSSGGLGTIEGIVRSGMRYKGSGLVALYEQLRYRYTCEKLTSDELSNLLLEGKFKHSSEFNKVKHVPSN